MHVFTYLKVVYMKCYAQLLLFYTVLLIFLHNFHIHSSFKIFIDLSD